MPTGRAEVRGRVALLEVKQDVRDSAVVVLAGGEIDSGTVDTLITHLDAALQTASDHPTRVLVIEMGDVTYFGSAGLNAVLGWALADARCALCIFGLVEVNHSGHKNPSNWCVISSMVYNAACLSTD